MGGSQAEHRLPGAVLGGTLEQLGSLQWLPNKVREIKKHLSEGLRWMSSDLDLFPLGCQYPGKAFMN